MSNLLEQAIIDATALKEVAMKNAEAALIEKYSKEFKESVERLLEQEEPIDAGTESPALVDPMAAAPDLSAEEPKEDETVFDGVPSSFLDGEDDELITIDFNQLKKQVSSALGTNSSLLSAPQTPAEPEMAATPEQAAPMMENIEIDEQELEEAYEQGSKDPFLKKDALHEDDLEEGVSEDVIINPKEKKKRLAKGAAGEEQQEEELEEEELDEEFELEEDLKGAAGKVATAERSRGAALGEYYSELSKVTEPAGRNPMAEDIEISAEELNELMEELKVDINVENLSDGYMGTTVTQKREQRNLEMAAARDSKAKEKREIEEKEISDLKEKLEEAVSAAEVLAEENVNLEEKLAEITNYLETLKENVEKLSISNAKLLYTNKVLGNVSLNERQKEQIVENISKSTSVLEAKTIYNTLQGAVSAVGSANKPKESLSEALIRGNSPFLTRKQQTVELSFADRMKQLAGITNK
jgi:hypothetical protein